ncbi:MAG: SurA N-terminal domain-containing protein, partial [Pseudomonadota bacterium]
MTERKRSTTSKAAIWIVVGLLMFAMVGFGAAGLSGTARSLGTVGDKQVGVQAYYNALTAQISAAEQQIGRGLSQQEIQAFGLDQQALAGLVTQRSLDQAATDLGLSVGDQEVRNQVVTIPAFSGLSGNFDRTAYRETLERNNLSESEFETSLRESAARDILAQAVVGTVDAPSAYADAMVSFIGETRDFAWVELVEQDLTTGTPVPTDDDLRTFHADNAMLFTSPPSKELTYIWVTPDMLLDDVNVSEAAIADLYQSRIDEFNVPETRILDRLIFPDLAAAQAAKGQIDAGTIGFEDAVENRGLTLGDVDFGDVTRTSAGSLADALFAPTGPGVVGPIDTDLGPALFRIGAILDAQETPLEDVAQDLRDELARDDAEQQILADAEAVNDLLAAGAPLQEIADESLMTLGTLTWHPNLATPINDYSEFQSAAADVTATDFPELLELSDGGYFAVEFGADVPAALQDYDTVKSDVQTAWERDAVKAELMQDAQARLDDLGDQQLSSLGLITVQESDIERTAFIDDVTPALVSTAFEMNIDETRVIEGAQGVILVQLNAIHPADLSTDQSATLSDLVTSNLNSQLAESIFSGFAQGVRQ